MRGSGGATAATRPTGKSSGTPAATPKPGIKAAQGRTAVDVATWAKWGLKPIQPAPAPPAIKPIKLTATGKVPVISRIPTSRKIVFITIDDGLEKDPKFITMAKDLRIPFTMFLMNDAVKNDYAYFRTLQDLGNHVQNHTLHHPEMSKLSSAQQHTEICGDQKILTQQYGAAPFLFRPPYGEDASGPSLARAVRDCGPQAIVVWRDTMEIKGIEYQSADKRLSPGDIILAHFRGPAELKGTSMTTMFANMLRIIQEQGFTVARLEDYVQRGR
jgi:peptidoglycan/xylan/chitin deacetylase (PgdA/CDA1 family)